MAATKNRKSGAAARRPNKQRPAVKRAAPRRRTASTSHGVALKVNPRRRGRGRGRRRNPVGGGVVGEAINLSLSGFAVTLAAPVVNRLVGGFLPLGQFQQPVIFAATGFGLAWVAGLTTYTRRFQRALAVMGVALGATAILTPWVRKFFGNVAINGSAGMSGYRRNMRGIAAVTGIPPNILPPPPAMPASANGMAGISSYATRY